MVGCRHPKIWERQGYLAAGFGEGCNSIFPGNCYLCFFTHISESFQGKWPVDHSPLYSHHNRLLKEEQQDILNHITISESELEENKERIYEECDIFVLLVNINSPWGDTSGSM